MANKINVLMIEPGKVPYMKEIESSLESLQREVGGYIEVVYPYEDMCGIITGEEAKLNGSPYNRALRDEDGEIYDIIAGPFMIVGLGEEDFTSLDEKLIPKYTELFKTPERFVHLSGGLCVVPMEEPRTALRVSSHPLKSKTYEQER